MRHLVLVLALLAAGCGVTPDASLDLKPVAWTRDGDKLIVTGTIHVNSKYVRSGLVLGVSGPAIGEIEIEPLVGQGLLAEEYLRRDAWTELGFRRIYIAQPRGLYKISVLMPSWVAGRTVTLVWRYGFEGDAASAPIVWNDPRVDPKEVSPPLETRPPFEIPSP